MYIQWYGVLALLFTYSLFHDYCEYDYIHWTPYSILLAVLWDCEFPDLASGAKPVTTL